MVVRASAVFPVLGRPATRGVRMFAGSGDGGDDAAVRDVLFGDAGKPKKGGAGKWVLILVVFVLAAGGGYFGIQTLTGEKGVDTGAPPQVADAAAPAPGASGAPLATDEGAAADEGALLAPEEGAAPEGAVVPAPAEGFTAEDGGLPTPEGAAPPAPPAPPEVTAAAGVPAAPTDPMVEFANKPRTKEALNAAADALVAAGASEDAVAPMRAPEFLTSGDFLSKAAEIATAAGLSEASATAAMAGLGAEYSDVLVELSSIMMGSAAAVMAGGPAPTSPAFERIQRRYPGWTFAEQNGNYVSNTGKLFVVSGGYVFPIERDFTVGRVF